MEAGQRPNSPRVRLSKVTCSSPPTARIPTFASGCFQKSGRTMQAMWPGAARLTRLTRRPISGASLTTASRFQSPGAAADVRAGHRRLNWVWYVRADAAEVARLLVDKDGNSHRASLSPGLARPDAVSGLHALAKREVHPMLAELVAATPEPFVQTIVDVVVPNTLFGRIVLTGDAAFVVRPHTAGATAKAAYDALLLGKSRACTQCRWISWRIISTCTSRSTCGLKRNG